MEHSNPKKGFSMSLQPKLSASSRTRRADRSNAAPALPSAIGQVHAAAEDIAPDRDYVIGMGEGKVFTKEIRVERGPRVIPLAEKPWKQRASKEVTATTGVVREGDKPQTVVSPGSADGHSVSSPHHTPATAQEEKSLDQQAAEAIARESRLAVRGDQLANGTSSNGLGRDLDSARVIGMATQASRGGGSSSELSAGARKLGLLEQNMIPGLAQIEGEDAKFRHDLGHRADDLSVQSKAYDETPISEFGAALLRGMGWGGPDGVDAATSSKPDLFKDVEPRHHRLGLGAQPKPPEEVRSTFAGVFPPRALFSSCWSIFFTYEVQAMVDLIELSH